jgi:TolA-binding protein
MSRERRPASVPPSMAEDLSVLSRRSVLSEPEQRRLDMCLSASPSLRSLHQVGRDFDQMRTATADDEVLADRLVQAVQERHQSASMRLGASWNRRTLAGLSALSVLLVALGAAAGLWRARSLQVRDLAQGERAPLQAAGAMPKKVNTMPAGPAASTETCPPLCDRQDNQESSPDSNEPRRVVKSSALPAANGSAASERNALNSVADSSKPGELFSKANAARRSGDITQAAKLYLQLQTQYPKAAETALSAVMLARIELGRGAANSALKQFDQYLRIAPGGSLAQEALQGRAQALGQLGRKDEQDAAYRELLRRFPDSVYAPAARDHLGVSQ